MTKDEFNLWFDPVFSAVYDNIAKNKNTRFTDGMCSEHDEARTDILFEDAGMQKFYTFIKFWRVCWASEPSAPVTAKGEFNFQTPERIQSDMWDKIFGGNDWAPELKGFRPVDHFFDGEGTVGFWPGRDDKKGLYLMESDITVIPLHVDFEGYLQLLRMSKGYGWWQNALIEISTGETMPNVEGFRTEMPQLFPDFSWEKFVELYQSVRIDK